MLIDPNNGTWYEDQKAEAVRSKIDHNKLKRRLHEECDSLRHECIHLKRLALRERIASIIFLGIGVISNVPVSVFALIAGAILGVRPTLMKERIDAIRTKLNRIGNTEPDSPNVLTTIDEIQCTTKGEIPEDQKSGPKPTKHIDSLSDSLSLPDYKNDEGRKTDILDLSIEQISMPTTPLDPSEYRTVKSSKPPEKKLDAE